MKLLVLSVDGLPHCPRNRSHAIVKKGKASFLAKTEAARSYEKALLHHLSKFKTSADTFRESFDTQKNCLSAMWELTSPEVLTKNGKVSENGVDLDAHKVLQDTIFEFIGIDDAYIMRDTRSKHHGDYYRVTLTLMIHELDGSDLL